MGWNTAEADPTLDTATTHRPKLCFSAWHSQWRFYPDGYSFLSHSLPVLVIWGQYFGISHLWSIAVQLLVQVAYICAWAHFSQTVTAETRPCLMIILTILVLEPDDGRETHGSAEQAGILLLLVPVLGPGAGGAVHPGHGTKYLKQWMILLNMLTTTNYSHAIILNLSHHRFTGFYQQNVKMFKRTFLQQNKDASQRRMHRILRVSTVCNTVCGASSCRPGGWHTTEERWLETPHPSHRPRRAEDGWQREAALQYSTVQHSTVQYSAVQEWEHGTMLDCLVMTGDPRWPRPGSNWKLQIGDQITSVTYNLYPGSSLQTPIYFPPSFVCLMWVFLRMDKHWTIKRTTHNLHLLFIFI